MAETIYLVTRQNGSLGGLSYKDDLYAVLINWDSAQTDAQKKAAAIAAAADRGHNLDANYFDTVEALGTTPTNSLADNGDALVFAPRALQVVVGD